MKKYIFILFLSSMFMACNQPLKESEKDIQVDNEKAASVSYSVTGKTATVFTTASNTKHRLEKSGSFSFEPAEQALESEISVFVNPAKTFQTFLGIGGAITDASAEIFAQLPAEKQNELITAYYDKQKGIAYSLCRTPIHSCDFSSESL